MALREMRWCRVCTRAQRWKHLVCTGETISSSAFHITRRTISNKGCVKCSKVKICERIAPGFLTPVEFLHRKVGWNAEGFSWTHDSETHTGNG